jgi:cyclopropane-fatty-acyl-phospholipid synthase
MNGAWSADDLTAAIRVFARNHDLLSRWRTGPARVAQAMGRIRSLFRRNTMRGSRRNIAAHYDLSNEFFGLWLDERMMYSSAWFEDSGKSLEEASLAKLDRICRKLRLGPEDHLLEIGTGWGGLALHAAREYGCRVTTTTISREQHDFARKAIREAGLQHRIQLLRRDYRELEGRYSKLVSVEMIEAVGEDYLDLFFRQCDRLLDDDGVMLLQAITIDDREYERASRSVDFIQHFIFPGGCLPSVHRMSRAVARETSMRLLDLEDLTGHYATTLRQWRERFQTQTRELLRLGFDERFQRMWEFYLSYCEAGFRERRIGDVHMLLAKPGYRSSSGLVPAGDGAGS